MADVITLLYFLSGTTCTKRCTHIVQTTVNQSPPTIIASISHVEVFTSFGSQKASSSNHSWWFSIQACRPSAMWLALSCSWPRRCAVAQCHTYDQVLTLNHQSTIHKPLISNHEPSIDHRSTITQPSIFNRPLIKCTIDHWSNLINHHFTHNSTTS